jgi:hypothetical protein
MVHSLYITFIHTITCTVFNIIINHGMSLKLHY